ncbi:MAG: molecular chaperone DnaJ [Candidatus Buchananbacteria bacterium]|nr:molecular chaperone DnaJ [Candidatus Buchananbacteria bacterium]
MGKDYYEILGVAKSASKDEVKKAFREKAHLYHPDKKDGDEKKFKEINEAYQVLGNEEKRKQYDQFGSTFDQQGGFGGGMNWDDFMKYARQGGGGATYSNVDFGDLGDILSEMFGGGFGFGGSKSRAQTRSRGRDIEVDLQLDFKEAVFGTEKNIELYKLVICDHCKGNGAEPGTKITECKTCQGKGQVQQVQQTFLGRIQTMSVCPDCQGEGKTYETPCSKCGGQGRIKEKKQIKIKVPAGVDNGMTIKMSGEGEAGLRGASNSDLYVHLRVVSDDYFKRQGDDIITQEEISFSQAALGDKIPIKTLDDEVKLKIPAGIQSGKVLSLKGKGIPRFQRSGRGDHLVEIIVKTPQKLNRQQKKILEELNKAGL